MAATQMKRIDMESIRSWLLGYVALLSSATASYSLRLAIASSMSQPLDLKVLFWTRQRRVPPTQSLTDSVKLCVGLT
jgi:hypothetical protein